MPAIPINITSISRTGNVVTVVTATAHGLAMGQAGWLQNVTSDTSFQGIYTVATVPNATTFTFNQAGVNATPVASGSVVPAKEWVVLSLSNNIGGEIDVMLEMWFPVTSGAELVNGSGSGLASNKLSGDETQAIAAGRIVVMQKIVPFPTTYSGAQMQSFIDALYTAIFSFRNSTLNSGTYYGYYSDGTANLGRV